MEDEIEVTPIINPRFSTIEPPVVRRFSELQREMMQQFYDLHTSGYASESFRGTPYLESYFRPADKYDHLDCWMLPRGEYKRIVDLADEELEEAIKRIETNEQTGGQKNKIISLKKEKLKRMKGAKDV